MDGSGGGHPASRRSSRAAASSGTDAIAARYFAAHEFYAWTGGVVL